MESVTAKLKSKHVEKVSSTITAFGQSHNFITPSQRNNATFSGHFKGASSHPKQVEITHNDVNRSSHMSEIFVSPRPPLHKKSMDKTIKNDRLILCKGCGSLSSNISNNCCQSGKDLKFALSPSISIGLAGNNRRVPEAIGETPKVDRPESTVHISNPLASLRQVNNECRSIENSQNDDTLKATVKKDPVLLVLSSDDEAPETSVAPRLKKAAQREIAMATNRKVLHTPIKAANRKELHTPIKAANRKELQSPIKVANRKESRSPMKDELRNDLLLITEVDISSTYEPYMCIKCNKVCIGSYKTAPIDRVLFMTGGIRFSVRTSSHESVTIALPTKYLLRIFWHSDKDVSFLVFYVTEKLAQHIRRQLGMLSEGEFYFDPCSKADSEKKLIIFPGELTEDILNQLNIFYNGSNDKKLFQKITQDVKYFLSSINSEGHSETSGRMSPTDPNIICNFNPRGCKGAITLTLDDFLCLEEGEFLNDVIIDFYLRYLVLKELEPAVAARTHVFSTYFYKRLTAKCASNGSLHPRERRHNRVQNWTKGVDIFDKDYIIIPINKKWHWFLALICFPNMKHPVRIKDGAPLEWKPLHKRKKIRNVENTNLGREESDRDETSSESSIEGGNEDNFKADEAVRQPCIIILDSLQGPSPRTKIVATLRGYIEMEFWRRKGHWKEFTKKTMRGIYPNVPQQPNYYDCGVYTLQYAESFFKNPLRDFSQSLSLEEWFSGEEVTTKREEITELIKKLRKEQFPNTFFEFPRLLTRDEIEEFDLFPTSDPRSQVAFMSEDDTDEEDPQQEHVNHENNFGWMDSFKNSISKFKQHFSTEPTPKRYRKDYDQDYCGS